MTSGAGTAERAGPARHHAQAWLRGALRGDLDNIVAKASNSARSSAYASAGPMAEDLRRYLDHLPVRCNADRWAGRSRKFVARHPRRVVLAAATSE